MARGRKHYYRSRRNVDSGRRNTAAKAQSNNMQQPPVEQPEENQPQNEGHVQVPAIQERPMEEEPIPEQIYDQADQPQYQIVVPGTWFQLPPNFRGAYLVPEHFYSPHGGAGIGPMGETDEDRYVQMTNIRSLIDHLFVWGRNVAPVCCPRNTIVVMIKAVGNIYARAGKGIYVTQELISMMNHQPHINFGRLLHELTQGNNIQHYLTHHDQEHYPPLTIAHIMSEISNEMTAMEMVNSFNFIDYAHILLHVYDKPM